MGQRVKRLDDGLCRKNPTDPGDHPGPDLGPTDGVPDKHFWTELRGEGRHASGQRKPVDHRDHDAEIFDRCVQNVGVDHRAHATDTDIADRSEEHTSELQSLMRISYAVFCLKKKKKNQTDTTP